MIFEVDEIEENAIKEWLDKIKPKVLKAQKKAFKKNAYCLAMIEDGEPYYGTSGGGLSYIFTATAIGSFLTVKEISTGLEFNVSEATGYHTI